MKSAPSLLLEPRRSRIEFALMCTIALLAITAVASSGLSFIASTLAIIATVLSLAFTLRQRRRRAFPRLQLQGDGEWMIETGALRDRAHLVDSRDLGFLLTLRFQTADAARFDLALWPDSISAESRRRLRVWLNGATATVYDRGSGY